MFATSRVDEGVVTQDDNTIDDGNDDASIMTDTDPADVLRAETIAAMRRADAISVANGRGTREERAAYRLCILEKGLTGDLTDDDEEGGVHGGRRRPLGMRGRKLSGEGGRSIWLPGVW